MTLFDPGPAEVPEPVEPMSADRRRTARAALRISRGIHPFTRLPLANNGESCGTCANLVQEGHNSRSYFKCGLYPSTNGAGTDLRLRWPACKLWSDS